MTNKSRLKHLQLITSYISGLFSMAELELESNIRTEVGNLQPDVIRNAIMDIKKRVRRCASMLEEGILRCKM